MLRRLPHFVPFIALGTLALPHSAHSADECGAIGPGPGYIVTCDDTGLNPYAGGITYAPPAGIDFLLATGVIVNRTSGAANEAVTIVSGATQPLFVTLNEGSEVHASGEDSIAVRVEALGNITIVAGGLVTTFDTTNPGDAVGPYGIMGLINGGGNGDVSIRLLGTGVVETDGEAGVGVYGAHNGTGNVAVTIDGRIETQAYLADGVIAWVNSPGSTGTARIALSETADVTTRGDEAIGAWSLNANLGAAYIDSAGRVRTTGNSSAGLYAHIYEGANAAEMRIDLREGGSVITEGDDAAGLRLNNLGTGDVIAALENDTSVRTSGERSDGVRATAGGRTVVTQNAGSSIGVIGEESFGLRLRAAGTMTAEIGGTVDASGLFGVGASALSSADEARITIGGGAVVSGGWQAAVSGTGGSRSRPSAGIIIGSPTSSTIENAGTLGALSDRALVDEGRFNANNGNLSMLNVGNVRGFIELADGGTNSFVNLRGGIFDVRHFADTDGDGDRDTKRVAISDFGAPTSTFVNDAGATVRLAAVPGNVTADATGYYTPTTGFDDRPLDASYYALSRAGIVQGQFVNLGTFRHAGVIDLRGPETGNTLLLTSNAAAGGAPGQGVFISDGGELILNTVMNSGIAAGGASGSFSDALIVDRTQMGTGATRITIDRRTGNGAPTPGNGILVVEVRDAAQSAAGVFRLNGDYDANGEAAIISGAHSYALYQNGVGADAADGNWYLRAVGVSPTVAVYENYTETLRPLVTLPTLLQRVGNREWSNAQSGVGRPVCNDAEDYGRCRIGAERYVADDPEFRRAERVEGAGAWSRIEGWRGRFKLEPDVGTGRAETDTWRIQAGYDVPLSASESGTLVGGVTAQYGTSHSTISGMRGAGKITSTGYGAGATLTWYGHQGFYSDLQSQVAWFDSDLSSSTTQRSLVEGNRAFGYAASIEAGQRLAYAPGWNLVPQSQLIYSAVDFDSFTDPVGTSVSLDDGESLRVRAGVNAEFRKVWIAYEEGPAKQFSAHGGVNIHAELLGGAGVNVSGMSFASQREEVWASLDIGGSYGSDNLSVYGEASLSSGLEYFAESYVMGAQGGFRARW